MTIISHAPAADGTTPNFTDYDGERARFSGAAVDRELGAAQGGSTSPTSRWLDTVNADRPVTERILIAALHLKAVALVATRFPVMNGFWLDGEFHPQVAVHLGVAISLLQGGLVLVARVRAGSMRSSEMSDPTLTVTNLGEQGVQSVYGVIYPPQVALVGFGNATQRPWVVDGTLRVLPVVTTTLAADHRVSDGHRGAQFLLDIRRRLQHPHEL